MSTSQGGPPDTGNVVAFQRPPVRQATTVRSAITHTFEVFVREIGTWWPLQPFSFGTARIAQVTFEREAGGRVYETWEDGTERDWGYVLDWQPPAGFTMTWNITGTPTEVELRFRELGRELTRVEVEHRGWDALTEEQLSAACALPDGYLGGAFHHGWAHILSCFATAIHTTRNEG
ncbi:MAG: SRPBCC domain-containing protein [Acidothermaceae bacterium]